MPGIITHHIFGTEAYEALAATVGEDPGAKDAFLLGNQGPDPLLCLRYAPRNVKHRKLGTLMHAKSSARLLSAFHDEFIACRRTRAAGVLKAYALGFLCHFLLDSTVHPLVYAQQYAVYDGGVDGLAQGKKGVVHAAIETELDEYVLTTHMGLTVKDFVPHEETLVCGAGVLSAISAAFSPVVESTYGVQVPNGFYASSVRLYRTAQAVLDAKRSGLRKRVDYARVLGASYQNVQAMTHEDCMRTRSAYANDEHIPWPHPFHLGSVVDASFDELYERAFDKALVYIPRFAEEGFSAQDCQQMTAGVNFQGKPIGRL